MPPSPTVKQRVDVGVQTIVGYAAGAGTLMAPAIAWAADHDMPVPVQVALIIGGMALAGLTGRNRSEQAVALTSAATPQPKAAPAIPPLPPADGEA